MHDEDGFYRFFAYLNLFMFSMLTLVLGSNYLMMFVGWEGVGLCSYLLIGYYFHKKSAGDASKKAFIVNRIGDWGFSIGIILIFITVWDVEFQTGRRESARRRHVWRVPRRAIRSLSISHSRCSSARPESPRRFLCTSGCRTRWKVRRRCQRIDPCRDDGHCGRLHGGPQQLHLPDGARRRCWSSRSSAPLTAFFAASIGIVQNDIKRVLAYSTVSQLGYMFLALGVGAFAAGIFHLMTHAFFKALLFLGSGSVIHAMHHEQDMRKMGALKNKIPITFWTMFIGTLAIAGTPGLAGFFSKDEILWRAFSSRQGHVLLWLIGARSRE